MTDPFEQAQELARQADAAPDPATRKALRAQAMALLQEDDGGGNDPEGLLYAASAKNALGGDLFSQKPKGMVLTDFDVQKMLAGDQGQDVGYEALAARARAVGGRDVFTPVSPVFSGNRELEAALSAMPEYQAADDMPFEDDDPAFESALEARLAEMPGLEDEAGRRRERAELSGMKGMSGYLTEGLRQSGLGARTQADLEKIRERTKGQSTVQTQKDEAAMARLTASLKGTAANQKELAQLNHALNMVRDSANNEADKAMAEAAAETALTRLERSAELDQEGRAAIEELKHELGLEAKAVDFENRMTLEAFQGSVKAGLQRMGQDFEAGESEKDRAFRMGESEKDRGWKGGESEKDRTFRAGESRLKRESDYSNLMEGIKSREGIAARAQEGQDRRQQSAQGFDREMDERDFEQSVQLAEAAAERDVRAGNARALQARVRDAVKMKAEIEAQADLVYGRVKAGEPLEKMDLPGSQDYLGRLIAKARRLDAFIKEYGQGGKPSSEMSGAGASALSSLAKSAPSGPNPSGGSGGRMRKGGKWWVKTEKGWTPE